VFVREGGRVAGLIVEPIQGEGGDRHTSPGFFRELRTLCSEHEVAFVVDEVQTGVGATGRFWAHTWWDLTEPPDIVTWSKKFGLGGMHLREELFPAEPYRSVQHVPGGSVAGRPVGCDRLEVLETRLG
jgi:4-aminobutyrate aminotransferase/(S)-3-amino-2-methylpropionate transaminase